MSEQTQVCKDCGKELPLDNFYRHSGANSVYRKECKACALIKMKQRIARLKLDPVWVEKRKKMYRERARGRTALRKGNTFEQRRRYRLNHNRLFPEQHSIRTFCKRLPKIPGMHNHHWSYREEHCRDIIRLPTLQHGLVHRFTIYDQEQRMYRRMDGSLIDSREAALSYYATLKD